MSFDQKESGREQDFNGETILSQNISGCHLAIYIDLLFKKRERWRLPFSMSLKDDEDK